MDLKETETEENYVRPSGDRIVHGLEQQRCCVQVVEWVGLVALFCAVFTEEVNNGLICGI